MLSDDDLKDPRIIKGLVEGLKIAWRFTSEEKQERQARHCGPGYDAARDIQSEIEFEIRKHERATSPLRSTGRNSTVQSLKSDS